MQTCPSCGAPLHAPNQRFCTNCGTPLVDPNQIPTSPTAFAGSYQVNEQIPSSQQNSINQQFPPQSMSMQPGFSDPNQQVAQQAAPIQKIPATTEPIYLLPESQMFAKIIEDQLSKLGVNPKTDIGQVAHQKLILTIIFSVLLSGLAVIYFFRFFSVIIPLIILLLIYRKAMKYLNTYSYIIKQIKSRPDENVAYVISSCIKTGPSKVSQIFTRLAIVIIPLLLLGVVFFKPHVFYEEVEGGYGIRFYTTGIINEKHIVVPETYNDQPIVSLRGELFKNLRSVEKITLPKTITEIRGETFYGCVNLQEVNLPHGITEIKADTFHGCRSLQDIQIPDGVIRIGAHAFDGCTSLVDVYCPDSVKELRSSSFRNCTNLRVVSVPQDCEVDVRAFKDSTGTALYR